MSRIRSNGDVPELVANPALAEKELGFVAKYNLEEMCRDQWNWQSYVASPSLPSSLLPVLTLSFPAQQQPSGLRGPGVNAPPPSPFPPFFPLPLLLRPPPSDSPPPPSTRCPFLSSAVSVSVSVNPPPLLSYPFSSTTKKAVKRPRFPLPSVDGGASGVIYEHGQSLSFVPAAHDFLPTQREQERTSLRRESPLCYRPSNPTNDLNPSPPASPSSTRSTSPPSSVVGFTAFPPPSTPTSSVSRRR